MRSSRSTARRRSKPRVRWRAWKAFRAAFPRAPRSRRQSRSANGPGAPARPSSRSCRHSPSGIYQPHCLKESSDGGSAATAENPERRAHRGRGGVQAHHREGGGSAAEAAPASRREGTGLAAHRSGCAGVVSGRRPGLAGSYERCPAKGGGKIDWIFRDGTSLRIRLTKMKRPGTNPGLLSGIAAVSAQHAADHAADEAAGAGRIGARVVVVLALRRRGCLLLGLRLRLAGGAAFRTLLFRTRSRRGRHDLGEQRLVLQLVEVAALGIAAGGLPACDHAAGGLIELAGGLGVEAEPGEAALHVAALPLVEADLVLGGLVRFLLEGRGIDACAQVAGGIGFGTRLKRGNARQGQRAELAVGIVAQIGVEL